MVAFDDCQILDVVGPLEVFDGASQLDERGYDIRVLAPGGGMLTTSSGLRLEVHGDLLRSRGPLDTVVVAGGAGTRAAAADLRVTKAIARLAKNARRTVSVCTGAFVLAAAGLLDGRRATTHWAYCDSLARRFPTVDIEPDSIFVRDGAVWTSAGVTAGIDLALALVEDDCGREVSLTVARHLVMFVRRPGGQSQFSAQLSGQLASKEALRELQMFIIDNVAGDLRVPALAARMGMSERNFTRVFRREVGVTPARFVEQARLDAARRLLEDTPLTHDAIADAVGFASADVFCRAFARQLGVSPSAYRARFSRQGSLQKEDSLWTS